MCKFCERVDSVIEAAESISSLEDWKALLFDMGLPDDDPEMNDIILTDDRNVWMNIIALIAATWCHKKKIPIFPATMTIAQHMTHVYQYGSAHRAINPEEQ